MKIFKSADFLAAITTVQSYERHLRELKRNSDLTGDQRPSEKLLKKITDELEKLEGLCKDVELENAWAKADLVRDYLINERSDPPDYSSLAADLRNVQDMVANDFISRKFIQIDKRFSSYINNDSLFGKEVSTAYPSAVFDIREAGNCIATECGTAAVFHLMRAAEWGLRVFCGHLKISKIPKSKKPGLKKKYVSPEYSQWEKILEELREKVDLKINKMKPGKKKQEAQEFYYPLLQDIKGFKDAWRNHVMHTRASYTQKDAEAVMDHVRRFLLLLSPKVTE